VVHFRLCNINITFSPFKESRIGGRGTPSSVFPSGWLAGRPVGGRVVVDRILPLLVHALDGCQLLLIQGGARHSVHGVLFHIARITVQANKNRWKELCIVNILILHETKIKRVIHRALG